MALAYDGALRFGLFFAPFHSAGLNPTYAFERDLMLAEHLDRLGFEEIWFGEHHSGAMEMVSAPELMIAAAAQRTKYIRLGTGVKSLPFHNPFMLAEAMAQLDHMTRGRAMFGIGPGALPSDVHMLGIEMDQIRTRMDEGLDVIVDLMKGATVTRKSDWYHLRDARLHVGCFTKPFMEMAVTSVRSPAGVVAAGRHGLGVLTLGPVTDAALEHHVENWRIYEAECAKHGHVPDRAKWRITVIMHLADTREKAYADSEWGFPEWIDYTHDVVPATAAFPRGVAKPAQFCNDNQLGIVGTPDDAIRGIRAHPPEARRDGGRPGVRQRPCPVAGAAPQLRAHLRVREAAFRRRQPRAARELRVGQGEYRRKPPEGRRGGRRRDAEIRGRRALSGRRAVAGGNRRRTLFTGLLPARARPY